MKESQLGQPVAITNVPSFDRLRYLAAIEATRRKTQMDLQAFWLTLRLAALVAAILVVVGLPVACWIAYSRWRWKFLAEAVIGLPIVLPPTVLGFYVLVALGPHSPLGRGWQALTGHTLAFTFEGLVIGSILYSLPFAVQPFAASFESVDRKLIAASATLGASRLRTFFRVTLPNMKWALLYGVLLCNARAMGEFGAVSVVSGHVRGETNTMPLHIEILYNEYQFMAAFAVASLLALLALVTLIAKVMLERRAAE